MNSKKKKKKAAAWTTLLWSTPPTFYEFCFHIVAGDNFTTLTLSPLYHSLVYFSSLALASPSQRSFVYQPLSRAVNPFHAVPFFSLCPHLLITKMWLYLRFYLHNHPTFSPQNVRSLSIPEKYITIHLSSEMLSAYCLGIPRAWLVGFEQDIRHGVCLLWCSGTSSNLTWMLEEILFLEYVELIMALLLWDKQMSLPEDLPLL